MSTELSTPTNVFNFEAIVQTARQLATLLRPLNDQEQESVIQMAVSSLKAESHQALRAKIDERQRLQDEKISALRTA